MWVNWYVGLWQEQPPEVIIADGFVHSHLTITPYRLMIYLFTDYDVQLQEQVAF